MNSLKQLKRANPSISDYQLANLIDTLASVGSLDKETFVVLDNDDSCTYLADYSSSAKAIEDYNSNNSSF